MSIPSYDQLFVPVLHAVSAGKVMSRPEIRELVAMHIGLSEEARRELLPSGRQRVFDGRVGWSISYLHKAGLLKRVNRGAYCITERGLEVFRDNPAGLSLKELKNEPTFRRWIEESTRKGGDSLEEDSDSALPKTGKPGDSGTPIELMESANAALRETLAEEILESLHGVSWQRFEEIVIDVLLALGYGGNRREAGQAFTTSGDHGVDGVIHEDRLGLSKIYVQAKRYASESPVSRPDVQAFVGSLLGRRSNLGVFITTSRFTRTAREYAENLANQKVVLIDGVTLARHMLDQGVGVSVEETYFVKRLDRDYFE